LLGGNPTFLGDFGVFYFYFIIFILFFFNQGVLVFLSVILHLVLALKVGDGCEGALGG